MKARQKQSGSAWRFWFLVSLLFLAMALILWRLVTLAVINREFLQEQGDARTLRTISTPAYRGVIEDRNGEPLAVSTPVEALWVNPKKFDTRHENIAKLEKLLGLSQGEVRSKIKANKKKEFVYLKRQVTPQLREKIIALDIPGLNTQKEFRRYYPDSEVLAQVLGITNIDDKGLEGIELEFNDWLQGIPGKKRVVKDRLGRVVSEISTLRPAAPGHNLRLTIDKRIQYLAYRELKSAITRTHAKSGSVVVLDPSTGEVLAMANLPSYNPNLRGVSFLAAHRNRAVTDVFEPGSTLKAFSVANALRSGQFTENSVIDTSPGWMRIDGNLVKETSWHNYGKLTVTEILQHSSNVGVSKLTSAVPPKSLRTLLANVGFGTRTGIEFPGETAGVLPNPAHWRGFPLAVLSFGYGLSVTNLQLASSYGILAAHGVRYTPTLLLHHNTLRSQQVVPPEIADKLLQMLQQVAKKGGTATKAKVDGYTVAGKTGTVRIVGENGYEKNRHSAIFVGAVPANHPRVVVSVVINDPEGKQYYGGQLAAPVFSKVAGGIMRMMNVPPDDLQSKT